MKYLRSTTCHNNNFSSFTSINVWWREFDFSSYLLKFLSVRPQYIRSTKTIRLCIFCPNFCVFSHNFHFFREIFALFFSHFFAKQIEAKFREKCEIFAKRFFLFAGNPTRDIISDPSCKYDDARLTTVPLKPLLDWRSKKNRYYDFEDWLLLKYVKK